MPEELPWNRGVPVRALATDDAVIVIPGIMGSELWDTEQNEPIWGLRPRWYARAWSPRGRGLNPLLVRDGEQDGTSTRVRATQLLEWPAFGPALGGIEPYTPLVSAIKRIVRAPEAVRKFPYDWRLSVRHNAELLAVVVHEHLRMWRELSGRPEAQVVLVAHSMGGLLCQALGVISGATDGVRATITLGTPFDGAAKAAVILGSGTGAPIPLPAQRLRRVAVTMPGIYDLLPSYRCVDEANSARALTPADVERLGADPKLAEQAWHDRADRAAGLADHHSLIGVEQPTVSSLTLANGLATGEHHTFQVLADGELAREPNGRLIRDPGLGDGTVPRNSGLPSGSVPPVPLAQQHATLAASDEAITFVRDVLLHGEADRHPRLGTDEVGLVVPDIVSPAVEWHAELTGIEAVQALVTVTDAETGRPVWQTPAQRRDDAVAAAITLPAPGLYRVRVDGGATPVTQFVLADEPER